jgi:hypothetical protein
MGLKTGDDVYFRLMPGMDIHQGSIVSFDETILVLQPHGKLPADLATGRYLIIPDTDSDCDYYTEITDVRESVLHLKRLWTGKRGFFRVDDVFPVVARKISGDPAVRKSRIISGISLERAVSEVPDGSVSPRVWNLLIDINAKLGMILEKLYLEGEGLTHSQSTPVNISASGIRLAMHENVATGDIVEVKMSLPLCPPVGVVAYGEVVRAADHDDGSSEVALQFINMDDDVRDEIIQYTFKRQREINRKG